MATRAAVVELRVLAIFAAIALAWARIPDLGVVSSMADKLDLELKTYADRVTGINDLEIAYTNRQDDLTFKPVDGSELAAEMAEQLGQMLEKKMAALKKSVDWAEKVAAEYSWNGDLELEDVEYVHAKRINESDPDFTFSETFQQKVSFANSSVHIPVEIYEGDIEILNGLEWTSRLDKQWRENAESDPALLWQYFGSQTGIMRNYPGAHRMDPTSKWRGKGVDLYDVRRRPWYTQGASSPKDMLILVDTSGSTHGQALALMKQSVRSLLDTLGENDFVNVARFSADASWIGCFETFVQANYRNKKKLIDSVDNIVAKDMASYTAGLEFAFDQFAAFEANRENRTNGEGADCNRIIMFLTDGGTEMPEELFKKYNWPEKRIRIFGYAVGPTANPIAAVKWIACSNRGYFYKIPAMGAIRSQVQDYYKFLSDGLVANQTQHHDWTRLYNDDWEYISVLARPMAMAYHQPYSWTNVKLDPMGLGMMTTVTLPVYNRTQDSTNQTILGVMGSDVTVGEMEEFIPLRKLGPNGYAFAINSNGYIVFHPNLKAKNGWLEDPPNVDFLEVEHETADKTQLRKEMIDGEKGIMSIKTWVNVPDERHIDNKTRIYHFQPIPQSSFSLAIVLPEYSKYYVDSLAVPITLSEQNNPLAEGASALVLADWDFCGDNEIESLHNESTKLDDLIEKILSDYESCQSPELQHLLFDAKVTKTMESVWLREAKDPDADDIAAWFVGTNGGLTRVYPASANESFQTDEMKNTWDAVYYKRAMDNDNWIYSAPYVDRPITDMNATEPVITATKAIRIPAYDYKPAVIGIQYKPERLRKELFEWVPGCANDDTTCYLLDDGGFLLLTDDPDDNLQIGRYFGSIEPVLWRQIVNKTVFIMRDHYDYQGACPEVPEYFSAGVKIVPPIFYEMLTLNWWTTKIAWAYLNMNLWSWLFPQVEHFAHAQEDEVLANYSCIKYLSQYHRNPDIDFSEWKNYIPCGNCTRALATSRLQRSNLVLVMVDKDCGGTCDRTALPQEPVETAEDPNFVDGQCIITQRYRKRPACYDYNVKENDSECGSGTMLQPSLTILTVHLISLFIMVKICKS